MTRREAALSRWWSGGRSPLVDCLLASLCGRCQLSAQRRPALLLLVPFPPKTTVPASEAMWSIRTTENAAPAPFSKKLPASACRHPHSKPRLRRNIIPSQTEKSQGYPLQCKTKPKPVHPQWVVVATVAAPFPLLHRNATIPVPRPRCFSQGTCVRTPRCRPEQAKMLLVVQMSFSCDVLSGVCLVLLS